MTVRSDRHVRHGRRRRMGVGGRRPALSYPEHRTTHDPNAGNSRVAESNRVRTRHRGHSLHLV